MVCAETLLFPMRLNKAVQSVLSGSMNIELKLPTERAPATSLRTRGAIWPRVWLTLVAVATVGWLLVIGWAAVTFVRWLWD